MAGVIISPKSGAPRLPWSVPADPDWVKTRDIGARKSRCESCGGAALLDSNSKPLFATAQAVRRVV
jgi:hypothetical protein